MNTKIKIKGPEITFWLHKNGDVQCDIDHGPGHHGLARNMIEALENAMWAWRNWEDLNELAK